MNERKPQCLTSIEVNGVAFFCLDRAGHTESAHYYATARPGRTGVTYVTWQDVPKPKRAKRKGGRRG